jgi:hypothetical protein
MATTAIANTNATDLSLSTLEDVLLGGDLSRLSPKDRLSYYQHVCQSVGLNPLTKPFDYLKLSGRLVLYARKDATDQLRKIHGVSIEITHRERIEDVYEVTAVARTPDGRVDSDTGAVNIGGLKGEALANALMKATTKAKRRVTLSICGLGMLDETETETIPQQQRQFVEVDHDTGEIIDQKPQPKAQQEPRAALLPSRFLTRLEELATSVNVSFQQMDDDVLDRYGKPGYQFLTQDEAKAYAEYLKSLAAEPQATQ